MKCYYLTTYRMNRSEQFKQLYKLNNNLDANLLRIQNRLYHDCTGARRLPRWAAHIMVAVKPDASSAGLVTA